MVQSEDKKPDISTSDWHIETGGTLPSNLTLGIDFKDINLKKVNDMKVCIVGASGKLGQYGTTLFRSRI